MIALLAGTATLGIVVQAGILLLFWRRTGLHVRPDFRWRGVGLGQIGRLAGWTFLMVVAGQLAGLVQSRVLSEAVRRRRRRPGLAERLAAVHAPVLDHRAVDRDAVLHAAQRARRRRPRRRGPRRHRAQHPHPRPVRRDRDGRARGRGGAGIPHLHRQRATRRSPPPSCCCASWSSLVPLAVLFVVQRTFYAYDDTRTPFFFTLLQCALVVVTALVAGRRDTCRVEYLAAGVALGQSIASLVQVIVATWLLHRRLGGLRIGSWMLSLGRFALAAVPAAGAGWLTFLLLGGVDGWTVVGQAPRRRRRRDHRRPSSLVVYGGVPRAAARARTRTRAGPRAARSAGRDADARRSAALPTRAARNAARLPCVEASGATKRGRTCVTSSSSDRVRRATRRRSTRHARTSSRSSSRARSRPAASS